jgi:hypothetical protein
VSGAPPRQAKPAAGCGHDRPAPRYIASLPAGDADRERSACQHGRSCGKACNQGQGGKSWSSRDVDRSSFGMIAVLKFVVNVCRLVAFAMKYVEKPLTAA